MPWVVSPTLFGEISAGIPPAPTGITVDIGGERPQWEMKRSHLVALIGAALAALIGMVLGG